jgi:hypothetical protein
MTPTKIDTTEKTFATSLKDSNGVTHSLINNIDIGEGCKITQIRPNFNSYYYTNETKKTAICLHFTVGNLKGDIGSLAKKDNKVSVQYVRIPAISSSQWRKFLFDGSSAAERRLCSV